MPTLDDQDRQAHLGVHEYNKNWPKEVWCLIMWSIHHWVIELFCLFFTFTLQPMPTSGGSWYPGVMGISFQHTQNTFRAAVNAYFQIKVIKAFWCHSILCMTFDLFFHLLFFSVFWLFVNFASVLFTFLSFAWHYCSQCALHYVPVLGHVEFEQNRHLCKCNGPPN